MKGGNGTKTNLKEFDDQLVKQTIISNLGWSNWAKSVFSFFLVWAYCGNCSDSKLSPFKWFYRLVAIFLGLWHGGKTTWRLRVIPMNALVNAFGNGYSGWFVGWNSSPQDVPTLQDLFHPEQSFTRETWWCLNCISEFPYLVHGVFTYSYPLEIKIRAGFFTDCLPVRPSLIMQDGAPPVVFDG